MNIMLTGGTGFIGSHVMQYLSQLGYMVDNISHQEFVDKQFKLDSKPDVVVHAAWPRLSDIHSLEHLEFAHASAEFMEECRANGVRVINLGSHNEYGVKFEPATENMICEPIDTYGVAKLAVTLYAKKLGFNTLRLFAVSGEGGRNFKSIYENSERYSHPENVKDFVPVELVTWAIERLMHAQHLYGEIINVSSGEQESAYELARTLCEETRECVVPPDEVCRECEIMNRFHQYPQRQYEPSMWLGDNTKMRKLLNLK